MSPVSRIFFGSPIIRPVLKSDSPQSRYALVLMGPKNTALVDPSLDQGLI